MSKYLFVTGITGQVGQYLLRELLRAGRPIAALVRSRPGEDARTRLAELVDRWSEPGFPTPRTACLEGDITLPGLGLSESDIAWIGRHCDSILHNAASLTFYGSDRSKDPWLSNLTGTQNVLDVCRLTGLKSMHYVSTAYVCGTRTGTIREDELVSPPGFRNDYEECKHAAEKLVRESGLFDTLTIYRPAMIVGDTKTGYTATYHGLYPYFQFVHLLSTYAEREEDGRFEVPVRLNLTGDEARNLVPIDWVGEMMAHILLHPELHGKTYHLTPFQPVVARTIETAMATKFGFYGVTYVGPDALTKENQTEIEKQFYEYVATYQPYWNAEPVFDVSNSSAAAPHLPCPPVDEPYLHKLIDFAVEDRWGKGPAKSRSVS
ncbi:MAG: SDR family oxidoreductase [Gemmataceae bacterium]|nr:SDR family oxidoreductase [Gemmataceae bacterium]